MADEEFRELVGNSDSEDDEFLGFNLDEIDEIERGEVDVDDIELDEDEVAEIMREVDEEMEQIVDEEIAREERDPKHNAYECDWLQDFTENSGTRNIEEDATEYEIFTKIVNDEIISLLTEETNRYFTQQILKVGGIETLKPHARARKWAPVTDPEMKAFIAMLLYIGLVRLPNYDAYWSTDELISLKGFTMLMPRDRFLNILSYFHAADNDIEPPRDSPNYDPTYKFSKLAGLLINNWQRYYCLHREMSIDETLIPFKGRTKFLQYIPSKPHKWGLKVWTLAESKSGYIYNWEMYAGKKAGPPIVRDAAKGIAHRVVVNICSPIVDKGHHLYCDNFFSSPSLFRELRDNQIGACGTLRTNRIGVPAGVKAAKPPKGDCSVHRDGEFLYISFMDKRLVNIVTTIHNSSTYIKTVRSRFHDNHVREVDHPKAIQLYTKYMGGVDSADQQTQYCVTQHRMVKWWKKVVICNLLEVSFCNAKILWKHLNPDAKKYCSKNFRLAVINGLTEGFVRQNNKKFVRPAANPPTRMTERHFPALNPTVTPAGRRSNPDCEVCSNREEKHRHQTQHFCITCNMPLCVFPCFERYHTLLAYKVTCHPQLHK